MSRCIVLCFFFFFQAEDGIRDLTVTGVQTCALPISHQAAAIEVARFLEAHRRVKKVHYPGLPTHPQYELGRRQMSGTSGLLSIELDADLEGVRKFTNALRVFAIGVGWGGDERPWAPLR